MSGKARGFCVRPGRFETRGRKRLRGWSVRVFSRAVWSHDDPGMSCKFGSHGASPALLHARVDALHGRHTTASSPPPRHYVDSYFITTLGVGHGVLAGGDYQKPERSPPPISAARKLRHGFPPPQTSRPSTPRAKHTSVLTVWAPIPCAGLSAPSRLLIVELSRHANAGENVARYSPDPESRVRCSRSPRGASAFPRAP